MGGRKNPWTHLKTGHDISRILRIRNFIREPLAGILNLELRTPKDPDIMCQMASAGKAQPDLGLGKCAHFLTGAEAKKSPFPPWVASMLIMNSGSGWAQLMPSVTRSCLKLGRSLALHHGSFGLVSKEQDQDLPGWVEELTRPHPPFLFSNKIPALLPQRINVKGKWDPVLESALQGCLGGSVG